MLCIGKKILISQIVIPSPIKFPITYLDFENAVETIESNYNPQLGEIDEYFVTQTFWGHAHLSKLNFYLTVFLH